jgi:hypothetical protein
LISIHIFIFNFIFPACRQAGVKDFREIDLLLFVPEEGLEPSSLAAHAPEACVFANFTTRARLAGHRHA